MIFMEILIDLYWFWMIFNDFFMYFMNFKDFYWMFGSAMDSKPPWSRGSRGTESEWVSKTSCVDARGTGSVLEQLRLRLVLFLFISGFWFSSGFGLFCSGYFLVCRLTARFEGQNSRPLSNICFWCIDWKSIFVSMCLVLSILMFFF